ncbi:C40 family peptidase [Acidipropionibacterium virtanenii]|uniref:Putative endopeptidase p60 n=1 Tax=Acidipropionibacterium virtanenii TaxID=2057246 RepID=A0A344UVD4_9ACTN|nr:C40 family peptidase [Acidipropionibacterium virtanenii]AXE39232.1 putative endopeptidase p60 [Acidipropionibacterium virtanenii]
MAQDRLISSNARGAGRGRRLGRGLAATALSSVIVVSGLVAGQPKAAAEPDTVSEAKSQLAAIEAQSHALDAKYTGAQADLDQAEKSLKTAEKDLVTQRSKVASMRKTLSALAANDYQSGNISLTAQMVSSGNSGQFLSQLATMQNVSDRTKGKFQSFQSEQARLQTLEKQAASDRTTIKASRDSQAVLLKKSKAKEADAKKVLASLTAEQQAKLAAEQAAAAQARTTAASQTSRSDARSDATASSPSSSSSSTSTSNTSTSASGRASTAIAFAKSKIGGPYVYGGTGPTGYDCSGLMQAAWAAAGVSLPRTSGEQFSAGTSVSQSDLQPGDLVFYYGNPPSHVGMYIGGGQIVHASNPTSGIKISPIGEMPISGARRVG